METTVTGKAEFLENGFGTVLHLTFTDNNSQEKMVLAIDPNAITNMVMGNLFQGTMAIENLGVFGKKLEEKFVTIQIPKNDAGSYSETTVFHAVHEHIALAWMIDSKHLRTSAFVRESKDTVTLNVRLCKWE